MARYTRGIDLGQMKLNILQRFVLIGLVAFSAVSTDFYLPAIPQIVSDFSASNSQGQLTLSVFMLGFGIGQLFYGNLSDAYGRKPLLFVGLSVYFLASIACVFANDIQSLILARGIQGIGAAAGPVIARAIVADSYAKEDSVKVMAAIASTMALVPALAPVLGGVLLNWYSWHALFIGLALFGALFLLSTRALPETCKTIGRVTPKPFAVIEQFSACYSNPRFLGFTLCGSALFAAMFTYISTTSFIIIELLGISPVDFGYTFMAVAFGFITGARTSSLLIKRWGTIKLLKLSQTIAFVACALLVPLVLIEKPHVAAVVFVFSMIFFAGGVCIPVAQMGAIAELPEAAGRASAVYGFSQVSLAALFGFMVGLFYNDSLLPTAIGVLIAASLSYFGYRLVLRKT